MMDITDYYLKTYKKIQISQKKFETKQDAYRNEINKISVSTLGKVPTIKFIFEILCNDVDKFFKKLKEVGSLAEKHHLKNFNKIVGNNKSKKNKISPFPLVIKESIVGDKNITSNSTTLNRTDRAYPTEVFGDIDIFPEVAFVEAFIKSYLDIVKSEEILNLKNNLDNNGNNKWIPISPIDSVINGRVSAISPYFGKFNPIPDLISEILNRFYIFSQYSYTEFFYRDDSNPIFEFFGAKSKQHDLLGYIAKGEAANIINSITDSNLLNSLSVQANSWKLNPNNFYDTLKNNVSIKGPTGIGINIYNTFENLSNPTGDFIYDDLNHPESFLLLNSQIITKDRRNPEYKGFELLANGKPEFRTSSNDGSETGESNAVDTFLERYANSTLRNFLFEGGRPEFDSFTKQNIMYVKDNKAETEFDSDFIKDKSWFVIKSLSDLVVEQFVTKSDQRDQTAVVVLSNMLSYLEDILLEILNDQDKLITNNVKAYIFATLFGKAIPYFDVDSNINKKFAFPAVVEIPNFSHLHMGALAYFYTTGATVSGDAEIFYFNNKYGNKLEIPTHYTSTNGKDATQEIQLISNIDYEELIKYFTEFTNNTGEGGYPILQNKFIELINEVKSLNLTDTNSKFYEYLKRLSGKNLVSTETSFLDSITKKITQQLYLLNYSQITFYPFTFKNLGFVPMDAVNKIPSLKNSNDIYFGYFFTEILRLIEERKKALRKIEDKFQTSIEDNDIKTQCYYSFKSVSDRWVLGFGQDGILGKTTPLIDDFSFIDRAGNDIGEKVIIDFRPIVEMSKDFDVSVFSVMTRILALNGFEFFPLQNFIDYSDKNTNAKFEDTFKISSSQKLQVSSSPRFVCMYIGGTSSQLDDIGGDFEDDGVQNLEELSDFKNSNTKAFVVSFAKQNQSIFTNIELDTNEHKETNESLSILSEIAQDQSSSSPVPKGQNLFSTYEQRSYTCKVEMLGCMMIQPTQYFMLQNVPMFRGAYMILHVQHNISANHMKTKFDGVRIKRVPQPFVKDFSTATGVKGGSADAHLSDPNIVGNAFNGNAINGVNPITNDQTSRLLSP
jgi:hypothetical protein